MTRCLMGVALTLVLLATGSALRAEDKTAGETIMRLKLSGPGAINDSTIRAGQPVSVDVYYSNSKTRRLFFMGLKFSSPDIKSVVHVGDSGKALNDHGDIKGHNGFDDHSIWDMRGTIVGSTDWDGTLPDIAGVGGVCIKQQFEPRPLTKSLSFTMSFPTPGSVTVDTCSWGPRKINSNQFLNGDDREAPQWDGPYHFVVVK